MQKLGGVRGWDRVAFAAAFQITMLEGTEVVVIVISDLVPALRASWFPQASELSPLSY
jgi:uncharacterized membrane protein